jgi:hypothetical protein
VRARADLTRSHHQDVARVRGTEANVEQADEADETPAAIIEPLILSRIDFPFLLASSKMGH